MQALIINTAGQLFHHYGLKSITMDDIATRAGISKKTIYHCFNNKNELIEAVFQDFLTNTKRNYQLQCQEADHAIEEMIIYLKMVQKFFYCMDSNILFDLKRYYPEVFTRVHQFRNSFLYSRLIKNLKRGIRENLYREHMDPMVLGRYIISTFRPVNIENLFSGLDKSAGEVEQQLLQFHLLGIVNKKGFDLIENCKSLN